MAPRTRYHTPIGTQAALICILQFQRLVHLSKLSALKENGGSFQCDQISARRFDQRLNLYGFEWESTSPSRPRTCRRRHHSTPLAHQQRLRCDLRPLPHSELGLSELKWLRTARYSVNGAYERLE